MIRVPLLAAMLLVFGASGAVADDRHNDRPPRGAQGHHRGPPPGRNERPAREAQERVPGSRILSVQPMEGGHRVKILKDGEVRVLTVPERDDE